MAGELKFTSFGTSITDLEAAWQDRLRDAEALLAAGRFAGALRNVIYPLEIRLKVFICKKLDLTQIPRAYEIHDLDALLVIAGLFRRIEDPALKKVKESWNYIKGMDRILPLYAINPVVSGKRTMRQKR